MKPVTLYFNELCLQKPSGLSPAEIASAFSSLVQVMDHAIEIRQKIFSDCAFGFVDGLWHAEWQGQSISTRLRQACGNERTRYQRLLTKIRPLADDVTLMREVHWRSQPAKAMTLADLTDSWVIGLALAGDWQTSTIDAERTSLDEQGESLTQPIAIGHLAEKSHIEIHRANLQDWGAQIAASAVLDYVGSMAIVMYQGPKEHNPPHVHVLLPNSSTTFAKYRIEDGVREKGPPDIDKAMKEWLAKYQSQLLRSWVRCQQGGMPYRLETP